jgi:hypothetical protein
MLWVCLKTLSIPLNQDSGIAKAAFWFTKYHLFSQYGSSLKAHLKYYE